MPKQSDALAALARIEEAQAALRDMLRGVVPVRLHVRPATGEWSAIENVRHLLFAEQHHFGPHLPKSFRWSGAGVPPPNRTGERRLSPVGSDPGAGVDEVFDAWGRVNDVIRGLCDEPDDALLQRLDRNLKHMRIHTLIIERLIAR
jgi:hypothetical protein